MSGPRRQRLEEIFTEASLVPASERTEFVRRSCNGDEQLCEDVLSLLAHHDDESTFLDHAELVGLTAAAARAEPEDTVLPPGTRIAGFTIGSVIGSGGMGVVYVAEQERPHRTVALKVMNRALRASGVLRRFELEAEVLGRLQHPGIAQVHEAGAADISGQPGGSRAQPYIAMELINGPPLDEFARRERLDSRQCLEIVARVCDAVHHAHQRGIIHRDLKPANILVDASGQPKVLDFGVARDTAQTNTSMHTGAGQLIGTLAYMSPEQVLADPEGIDTRADVYALGVILYQLLTGRLPHQLDQKALPEAARIIRDEEPSRPGTWDRILRGEIETIVLKALCKDRQRRYQSAADLAQDVRRFLDGRPIAAKDDSAFYVLRKQIRRHRGAFAAAAVVLCMLIAFAIYAQVQSTRNRRSAISEGRAKTEALESLKAAKDARVLADQTSQRLQDELIANTVERGRLMASTGDISAAESLLWPAFLRNPDSHQTEWALWELYSREPCLATMQAHPGGVNGVVLSPDERRLYSAGADGRVCVWNRVDAQLANQAQLGLGPILDVCISVDGRTLAIALQSGDVVLLGADDLGERWRVMAHEGGTRAVSFSPDGAKLASAGNDNTVRVWDAGSGDPSTKLPAPARAAVCRVVWSPDGAWLAFGAGQGDGRVMLWDGTAHPPILLGTHAGGVQSLAMSPVGGLLASGGADRAIRVWEVATQQSRGVLLSPNGFVASLRFTADGGTLLSTGWWTLDLWDVNSGQRRRAFSMRGSASASTISADGTFAVGGLAGGQLQLWDATPDAGWIRLTGHEGRVAGAINRDGRIAITGDSKGVLRFWDAHTGTRLATLPAHPERLRSIRFSHDGRYLATGAEDNTCKLWDLQVGRAVGSVDRHASITDDSVTFSPDGRRLAIVRRAAGQGWFVSIVRVPDLSEDVTLPVIQSEIVSARFTPDGTRLATASRDKSVRIFPLGGGNPVILKTPEQATPWSLCFSADGSQLVVGDWNRELEVWDMNTSTMLSRFRGHRGLPASVEFLHSPPEVVVSSATDGGIRLWDTSTNLFLASLSPFEGWDALSLSIASDGRRLLCTSARGDAIICDLSYFARHIAMNAEEQIRRVVEDSPGDQLLQTDRVRTWAAGVISSASHPEPIVQGSEVTPEVVLGWARPR